jgi:hypothetical protein
MFQANITHAKHTKKKDVRFHQLIRSIWLCQNCSTSQTCLPVSTYSETLNISQLYINRPGRDCDSWSACPMSTCRINGSRSRSPFTWLFVHFYEFAYIASVDVVVAFEPVYKSCMIYASSDQEIKCQTVSGETGLNLFRRLRRC